MEKMKSEIRSKSAMKKTKKRNEDQNHTRKDDKEI
jgi:hypothetical protein